MQLVVLPPAALPRMRGVLSGVQWELDAADGGDSPEAEATLEQVLPGGGVAVVPPAAAMPSALRRVLVVHDGTLLSVPAVEAADHLAVRTGSEVVVVHAAQIERDGEPGTLTAPRLVDHGPYDWEEWRDEFVRRFCPVSTGVPLTLELATGDPVTATLDLVAHEKPDLLIATWDGEADSDTRRMVRVLMSRAPCPMVIVGHP